jgi:hypothetical protein
VDEVAYSVNMMIVVYSANIIKKRKSVRLLVWCLFLMFWVGEWTHQTCCPFLIWLHHDIRLAVPSFCVLISIEPTMDFMNQCRVRCDSLMRSLVWFRSDPGSVFESSESDFVDLSNSSFLIFFLFWFFYVYESNFKRSIKIVS